MLRIQSTESVCQLGKANSRVMTQPVSQKLIDLCGRPALQNIQIYGRVQKQWAADSGLVVDPWQIVINPTSKCPPASVWFE